jgi:hypothetical protein
MQQLVWNYFWTLTFSVFPFVKLDLMISKVAVSYFLKYRSTALRVKWRQMYILQSFLHTFKNVGLYMSMISKGRSSINGKFITYKVSFIKITNPYFPLIICSMGIFLFTTASRTALAHPPPPQPPIQWVPGALSLGLNRSVREVDHSPPSSARVKNAWSYNCTPPIRRHSVMLS